MYLYIHRYRSNLTEHKQEQKFLKIVWLLLEPVCPYRNKLDIKKLKCMHAKQLKLTSKDLDLESLRIYTITFVRMRRRWSIDVRYWIFLSSVNHFGYVYFCLNVLEKKILKLGNTNRKLTWQLLLVVLKKNCTI